MEQHGVTERSRDWLLFTQVDNEVLFVNPKVHTPLQLKEKQPTSLGVFAEAAVGISSPSITKGKRLMEYVEGHHRSSVIGQVLFADQEGRVYRDIDLKGIGTIGFDPADYGLIWQLGRDYQGGRYGLVEKDTAFSDCQVSEQFLQAGIRTYRILGIIGLKELVVEGKRMTLKKAVKEEVVDEDFHPVLEVRAFGTRARITEIMKAKYRVQILEDAKSLLAKELGKEDLSDQEYIEWFAKTLATNVALIHKNGWYHNYLTGHNITLDGRVVDLDSVGSLNSEDERTRDFNSARGALEYLAIAVWWKSINCSGDIAQDNVEWNNVNWGSKYMKDLRRMYEETYDQIFPVAERNKYFRELSKPPIIASKS